MKPLHERLRECGNSRCIAKSIARTLGKEDHFDEVCFVRLCGDCGVELAGFIADEIERTYIHLPTDDKGEPWRIGDTFEHIPSGMMHEIVGYETDEAGNLVIVSEEHRGSVYRPSEIRRPAPKVLDADGVETKVGDTVYEGGSPNPLRVVHVYKDGDIEAIGDGDLCSKLDSSNYTHECPVFDAEGVRICKGDTVWRTKDGLKMKVVAVGEEAFVHCCEVMTLLPDDNADDPGKLHYSGKELTHREPDSLEKIEQDMRQNHEKWVSDPNEWLELADRISAIVERGA